MGGWFYLVSYDIEKDGVKVAVLSFVKSAYRLGETILGVVDINFPGTKVPYWCDEERAQSTQSDVDQAQPERQYVSF